MTDETKPPVEDPKSDLLTRLTSRAFAIPILATWMLFNDKISEDSWLMACGIFAGVNAVEKFQKGRKQ